MKRNTLHLKFGGNMYIILVYDILLDDGGSKVLRNVFKTANKYLFHIQNSVFEGEIENSQLFILQKQLKDYLREEKDSCIIFKSRNKKWLEKEFLTNIDDKTDNFL